MEETLGGIVKSIDQVSLSQWRELAGKRIVFGHQSVGGNIIAGLRELLVEEPRASLDMVEITAGDSTLDSSMPALYHGRFGSNRDAMSKMDAFDGVVRRVVPEVAMLKFCYVDVDSSTQPEDLFRTYERRMRALREALPSVVIVHWTMPLTSLDGRLARLRELIGGSVTQQTLNSIRSAYNERLRRAYEGREPVFDLAAIESTLENGTTTSFRRSGSAVPFLAPDFTSDGGHLNERGRRAAARALVTRLAAL